MVNSNFVTLFRQHVQAFLDNWSKLRDDDRTYTTLGLGSSLAAGDFTGANADLTVAQFEAAVGSWEAIDTFITSNFHWANLEKMRS